MMKWTARRTPLTLLFVPLLSVIACAELRVATDGPPGSDPNAEVEDDEDAGARTDALALPDVHVSDAKTDGPKPKTVCDGPCPPEVIVDGLSQATALTVDATNVYFAIESGNGTVYQCPKTGCGGAPIELGPGYATSIVVAGGIVYWGDFAGGKLQGCAVGGCGKLPSAVVSNQTQIKGAVSDGVDLFWGSASGLIRHCPLATCSTATAETIATNQGFIRSLAADQGKVVWPNATTSTVYACAAGPCANPTALGPGSHGVSVHAGKAYWVNGQSKTVVSCSIGGCGGSPVTIGSSMAPNHPVSDGSHVYWRDDFLDQIYRCPVSGCSPGPETIATAQRGQPGGQIALDGEYVYWTTTKGVYRLPK